MAKLQDLQLATTIHDVADLLGFKPSALAYIVYKLDPSAKYQKFDIPKRYGGFRKICAPLPELKLAQSKLSKLLQDCVQEINVRNGWKDQIAHGFKREKSIITNARCHRNRNFVFNIDLEDFFGAINFGRVRGFFIKDTNFSLQPSVATLLAQIACFENSLPQGSPCSPVISNLIGHVLDVHLVRLAAQFQCVYTRYADDLTFSTNEFNFPKAIASPLEKDNHTWIAGTELERLITKCGFKVNASKTRMQYHDSRQEVTGLVVNKKVNVRNEYRHTVRAMVHRLFTTGNFDFEYKITEPDGSSKLIKVPGTTHQLHGMLGFINSVDQYNANLNSPKEHLKSHRDDSKKELIYRRFLLFKEFYAAQSPVLICEGPTDNIYLVHAIRSLAKAWPRLATIDPNGKITLNLRIYKYPGTSTGKLLNLSGGYGDLNNFIKVYKEETARFKAPGMKFPVLLLVDNDSGGKAVFNTIGQVTKRKPPDGTEPFVHIVGNLYLIATPLIAGTPSSAIEDFFDSTTKAIRVGAKSFDPAAKLDSATHFGKTVFAHKVVRPLADKINFSAFGGILARIESVLDAHSKRPLASAPPPKKKGKAK